MRARHILRRRPPRLSCALVAGVLLALGSPGQPAHAQCGQVGCGLCPAGTACSIAQIPGTLPNAPGCLGLFCNQPQPGAVQITATPQPDGSFTVRAEVAVDVPGNRSRGFPGCTADAFWFSTSPPLGDLMQATGACHSGLWDKFSTALQIGGLRCPTLGSNAALKVYSLSFVACNGGGSCARRADVAGIDLSPDAVGGLLGCPVPPTHGCPDDPAAGVCCLGPAGGSSAAGGPAGIGGEGTGPGAHLRYRAGGAGGPDLPGSVAWNAVLGRYWSHDYAERIVVAPDPSHVWLITRHATFREFGAPDGSGVYQTRRPSDEYRKLRWLGAGLGWELRDLEGGVQSFDAAGRWTRTVDRNGNARVADYSGGPLTRVTLPDGRREDFSYHPDGKLREIREVGVDGTSQLVWTYTWSAHDLTRIDRPDGTALELVYGDARFPGYLTRLDLVGTDLARRVEGAWEYDAARNVQRTWRGDVSAAGPAAVDTYSFSFDNPLLPARTVLTDPLGRTTTYDLAHEPGSRKPKLTRMAGDCPVCGVGPTAVLSYDDAANPLLATRRIDGRLLETQSDYDANGRLTSRTEAAGTPLARTTTWTYANPAFPAFPTRIEQPSTAGGVRASARVYGAAGDLTTRTETGAEAGSAFSLATVSAYNAAGRPLSVDPPGYSTADMTSFTYDPARGGLVPTGRTDPLIGASTFGHDAFNRRTSVTDPNGVETTTAYDGLDRPTVTVQKGATPAGDLVTTQVYDAFGDLVRTVLPRGNLIEYGYDAAGRLVSVERRPDAATHGERTSYTLDAAGHRIKEELQGWDGTGWVTASFTDFVYGSRCHLDKVVHADGSATEYGYDCNDNLERVWDANHPRASNPTPSQLYTWDSLDRLTAVSVPWAGAGGGAAVTGYGWDVQDHLTRVTDAEGNVTTFTYGDRDLMTEQLSPAAGALSYRYNEHGELVTRTDARGIVETRAVDALDRVTAVDYPGTELDTAFTWDDPGAAFSRGRLTRIARDGGQVDYAYDRFGRLLQDGALTYEVDANGNRTRIGYPGGVAALYTHDFADREATLALDDGLHPPQALVSAAAYEPFGPLSGLTLGNGLAESRGFDTRYRPASLQVPGRLAWTYTVDDVGNVTAIADGLVPSRSRSYAYQDHHYFLTAGAGPWGSESWTYDRSGNRLAESLPGEPAPFSYAYPANPAGGRAPRLESVAAGGDELAYLYDAAGNQEQVTRTDAEGDERSLLATWSAEGRLAELSADFHPGRTALRYDGRGFLRDAHLTHTSSPDFILTQPTYSSEGLLYARRQQSERHRGALSDSGPRAVITADRTDAVFYFAGRPVAQHTSQAEGIDGLRYLTTDHLGTPVLATDALGGELWQGGLRPFGDVFDFATTADGTFLRFPGQWEDPAFSAFTFRGDLYYNVHRWYEPATGRYTAPEPAGVVAFYTMPPGPRLSGEVLPLLAPYPVHFGQLNLMYGYADQAPLSFTDPDGAGVLKWIQCAYYSRRCLISAFRCRDFWRDWFRECYRNEDFDKLQENLRRAGVATDAQFIYKVCFLEDKDCQKATKTCTSPPVFKP